MYIWMCVCVCACVCVCYICWWIVDEGQAQKTAIDRARERSSERDIYIPNIHISHTCMYVKSATDHFPHGPSLQILIVSALQANSPAGCTWILPELSHLEPPLVECNWRPTPTKDSAVAWWAFCDDGHCICTEKCLLCQWGSRTNHSFGRKQPVASNLLLLQPVAQLGLLQTITN